MGSARHVIGSHLAQETRVENAFDDVVGTIHESLPRFVGAVALVLGVIVRS